MQKLLITAAAALVLLSCDSTKKMTSTNNNEGYSAANEEGFVSLFDGKTTKGWHTYGKATPAGKAWKVKDGTLYLDAASKKDWQTAEGGDIVTDEEFDNFHLKYEWKISPKGNSGVVFFIKEEAQYPYMWHTGPEMQMLDNGTATTEGHPDGKITSHRSGDLYDLVVAKEATKPLGEWNLAEIIANNGKLDFYMNGQHTLSTTMWDDQWRALVAKSKFKDMPAFGKFKKGRIGLQDHGNDVWFRNIRIKKL